jgi:rRNA maturation RNase YbeY
LITIQTETDPAFPLISSDICTLLAKTVFHDQRVKNGEITFIFANDEMVAQLKKEFFNVEQLTDVIAFRLNDYSKSEVEGEIYISIPRAKENAKFFNEPIEREIARLIIHGSLHLLNYDDQTEKEQKQMRKMEETYLQQIKWKGLMS